MKIDNLVFELTQACNQSCRFCYNYWRDGSTPLPGPDPVLARKTLKKLLSQTSVGTLAFSGGEPLLLPNIHDLALYARFKGCRVNVLTNGTLLTQDAVDNFKHIGLSAIQIPILSADPAVHDTLTNLPGSWKKATAAASMVVGVMPREACSVLVITRENAPGITETLELIKKLGISQVMVNRFNLGGMGLKNKSFLTLDRDTLKKAFAETESFAAANPDIRFVSGVCTPICVMDPAPYPHIRFTWCSTDFSRRPVAVSYTGDVRFCNHSPHIIGNIHQRSISDILTDPVNIGRYVTVPDHCRDCSLFPRCNGGCRAASEQAYGSFNLPDPVVEVSLLRSKATKAASAASPLPESDK